MTYRFLQLYFRWTRKDLLHHVGYLPSVEKNNSTGKGITRLLTRLLAGKLKLKAVAKPRFSNSGGRPSENSGRRRSSPSQCGLPSRLSCLQPDKVAQGADIYPGVREIPAKVGRQDPCSQHAIAHRGQRKIPADRQHCELSLRLKLAGFDKTKENAILGAG